MSAKKTSAMGVDPLDNLMGDTKASRRGPGTKTAEVVKLEPTTSKTRATFHLPTPVVEECRDAVVFLAGPPERLTMARLVERAIQKELKVLRDKYNKGKPFPRFEGELKGGRPIGT
jgi:hypothetical protein